MINGLARKALEMAAAYAVERHAFGRPIGGYQGIAHPLADTLSEVEGAELLLRKAIWAVARDHADASALVSMAYWWATQSAVRAVSRALHTFGGYGVSLEYDIQLYYRRAKAWALLGGDPQQELLRAGRRLWLGESASLPDAGEMPLEFGFGPAADAHAAKVRQFFVDTLTPELRAKAHHSVGGYDAGVHRKLAAAGLLFPHWPEEFGGGGQSVYDYYAGLEQFSLAGWEHMTGPITNSVGDIVRRFATTPPLRRAVAEMAAGEALGCLGFSEPSGGSDIFGIKSRAEQAGEGRWVINGSKIFTTAANVAKYCFLLVRTDPSAAKHAGLSVFLVPLNTPGIEIQAVETMQDERTNIVYFADVRVDDEWRIGEVNGAMAVMAAMLKTEHGSGDQYRQGHAWMLREAITWAQQAERGGRPLLEDSDAMARLARAVTHGEVSKVLCHRAIWMMAEDLHSRYWGPMAKVFATEIYNRDAMDLMDLAAPDSLGAGQHGLGAVEIGYRQSIGTTIYGGASEVLRSLIAEQALGLPKSRS
jgi:alkylation response protein AidB-like acyl-CoA dehydrogenase